MDAKCNSTFQFTPGFTVTREVKEAFDENGYIILKNLLDSDEVTKLTAALESEKGVLTHAFSGDDCQGRLINMVIWNQPGNDITGVISRTEKVAGTFEKLLDGEVYHYHAKVILKEAKTGGSHTWHQDFGYWYNYGCLFPNLGTVWIAVDKADKENGCLQLLERSHKLGRIDHIKVGEQEGADPERLEHVKKILPLIYCEVEPGDAIFFHCNVLHCSTHNNSDRRRWAFLVAYNRADNDPGQKHHHSGYVPLHKVPDSAIKECSTATDITGKNFFIDTEDDFEFNIEQKSEK